MDPLNIETAHINSYMGPYWDTLYYTSTFLILILQPVFN